MPESDARVRVTTECPAGPSSAREESEICRTVGSFRGVDDDSVAIARADGLRRFSLAAVRRLEVSRGTRSHWKTGALVGGVVGTGATAVVLYTGGSTAPCDRSANQDAISTGECAALTAGGGLLGAGLGAAAGLLFRSERWENIPLGRLGIRLSPIPGGGLGPVLSLSL